LVSWLNLYRTQKPSFVKEFLLKTKENHQQALKSLDQLQKILAEDATIYLGFRMLLKISLDTGDKRFKKPHKHATLHI